VNGASAPVLVALVIQLAFGFLVFQSNRERRSNQCFLLLSLVAGVWLLSLYCASTARDNYWAAFGIREASAAGAAILASLNLLRLSIRWHDDTWSGLFRRSRVWSTAVVAVMALCQTEFFLRGARLLSAAPTAVPEPIYGPGVYIFAFYFAAAACALIIGSLRDLRDTSGRTRAELLFVLISGLLVIIIPVPITMALKDIVGRSRLFWFLPLRVLAFDAAVGYGIATRKVMEVGVLFRRATGYAVLATYLLVLYTAVWWLVATVAGPAFPRAAQTASHTVAALIVAFAMAPARGLSQRLANRLFVGTRSVDFRATMNEAAAILRSVTTLSDLLKRFAKTIADAVGTERVLILLRQRGQYLQNYPVPRNAGGDDVVELSGDEAVIQYLSEHQEPVVLDELYRIRQTPVLEQVIERLTSLDIAVVMGIFARDHLAGVMLLGPRVSRRIYGTVEQNALQVLCGQLAVAIENAELFTEVENARIYNETLLQNLTTGVIAVGADERVTVFNNEAGQISGRDPREMIDRPLDDLPPGVRDMLRQTLRTGERQENSELVIRSGNQNVIVRASSSIFHGQQQQMLGALVVVTDITALKRLELQIRRSDRLASLGTLSAGMAHEIKNPLVSIKTFAQLLPERYQDSDFRETFSNLIGHEIDRIDSLVNQLLRFARPAKPLLKPMHVHEVIEKSLQLVGHRLYQKEIKLTRFWDADLDTIRADADQLEQVFLNFFLNAMEAMKHGGELSVGTRIERAQEWMAAVAGSNGDGGVHEVLRITIRDNGEGIRSEDIPHVFDPFFTTKDYGTGLGLSVVHGIVQEHGGHIEVESELCKGTAFHILLPLVRFEKQVAAA
jgi:PAS domain S-box-containing protein